MKKVLLLQLPFLAMFLILQSNMPLLILHPVPPLPPLPTYFALTFLTLLWSVLQAREDISVFEQSGIAVMTASDVDPSLQTLNLTHLFAIHEEDYVLLKYAKTMAHDSWSVLVSNHLSLLWEMNFK